MEFLPACREGIPLPCQAAEREFARSSSASSPLEAEFLLEGVFGPFLEMVLGRRSGDPVSKLQ